METVTLTLDAIETLARTALERAGTSSANAASLAAGVVDAEREGIASHGLAYVPTYCEHVRCGKVDGGAAPMLALPRPGAVFVDAATGFAHPAIDAGLDPLMAAARINGVAVMGITNSYNCGVLGFHTKRIAQGGLIGLGFTNAPASIAPAGGTQAVVGTNPFSLAVPAAEGGAPVMVIDQSASVIAKSEVMKRAREGEPIPEGWVLDAEGRPTTDAEAGLKGTMVPSGGYKGFGAALLVEVMAAALSGATLGLDASPFSGTAGGPPKTGQAFIAIDPGTFDGAVFAERMTRLAGAITAQEGAQLHGAKRAAAAAAAARDGVAVNKTIADKVTALA